MGRKMEKSEYGDFQTPLPLAKAAAETLCRLGVRPKSVLEPTCGRGSFLVAAVQVFSECSNFIGVDLNSQYLSELNEKLSTVGRRKDIELYRADFFSFDWSTLLSRLPEPILIVGNPPWVTSSDLGTLASQNVPEKSNFQKRRGIDAITGKSNFDISEWMLLQHLGWLQGRRGVIAVLCKTAVARKVLSHAWKLALPITGAKMFAIDAQKHFGASVDACFLVLDMPGGAQSTDCVLYDGLESTRSFRTIGYHDGIAVSDVSSYEKWRKLRGNDKAYVWRSGIKHDCSKVMELELQQGEYRNGLGEILELEDEYIYPMMKSSDVGNAKIRYGHKFMLVTQKYVGEDTTHIRTHAPKTWRYLQAHDVLFERRASSIYRSRPNYSIFGVGDYSFSSWKVVISGFYKRLAFKVIGPFNGKPVVLDDTVYFLPCWSESEADFLLGLLNSEPAQAFFASMIFWSDKRPITIEILKRLDLHALSVELKCESEYLRYAHRRKSAHAEMTQGQLSLAIADQRGRYSAKQRAASRKPHAGSRKRTARR